MMRRAFWLCVWAMMLLAVPLLRAGELPAFKDDQAADAWLRKNSAAYRKMAETMDKRGGYEIKRSNEYPRSMMICGESRPTILLNDHQIGAERVTLLIFEFSNASQADKFREISLGAGADDAAEYAILHMLLEYESLKLHQRVLADLDKVVGGVPAVMFQVFLPAAKSFAEYELPNSYDYIKLRKGTEYRKYYENWFREHVGKKASAAK